jgi:hypothetical protein
LIVENNIQTVFRINRLPPPAETRPPNFRYIAWFCDVFPSLEIESNRFQDGDIVFTLGTKETLGLNIPDKFYGGSLDLCINPNDFASYSPRRTQFKYDTCLVGYVPDLYRFGLFEKEFNSLVIEKQANLNKKENGFCLIPPTYKEITRQFRGAQNLTERQCNYLFELIQRCCLNQITFEALVINIGQNLNVHGQDLKQLVRSIPKLGMFLRFALLVHKKYSSLSGSLNIDELTISIEKMFGKDLAQFFQFELDLCVRELPRLIDRIELLQNASAVTHNIGIYGSNWNKYSSAVKYWRGLCSLKESYAIFNQSKISLHNNNHGIGMHSRTLSAMASGSFVMSHSSYRDTLPGGIKTYFTPNVHYGEFTPLNFKEVFKKWLNDDVERFRVSEKARSFVLKHCTWQTTAKKLIQTLSI